eukprot:513531_1
METVVGIDLDHRTADDPDHIDVGEIEYDTTNCFNLNRATFKLLISLAISVMGFILGILSIQVFNELGALYDKQDECVNQYIPETTAIAFRGTSLIVFFMSILLVLLGCYGVRCLGWGMLLGLLAYLKICCQICEKLGGHRKIVYWFLVTVNTCLMIVLFALGTVLDVEFDNIKENCSGEAVVDIEEIDREFLTMNVFALVGGASSLCMCFGCLNSDMGRCFTRMVDCVSNYTNNNAGCDCDCDCDDCCDGCCEDCCDGCDCDCDCGGGDCLIM